MVEHITSLEAAVCELRDVGISIFVPENSLSSEEECLDLSIHPCFSGAFELPDDYRSASPTYLIRHDKRVTFLKDITVRMLHHTCLQSQSDCEDMVFFSASSIPQYRSPVQFMSSKRYRELREYSSLVTRWEKYH